MRAIVLAAGMGSRLGPRTQDLPKPCVTVAGRRLLEMTVKFGRAAGAEEVVVVTGYRAEITAALASDLGVDRVLHNPRYADGGNLLSLDVAVAAGLTHRAFLLMNSDHVYHPSIAEVIRVAADGAEDVVGFVDRDRTLGPDDMKARLDPHGRIVAIAKDLEAWDVGYVGLTLVPGPALELHGAARAYVLREVGDAAHVEAVLARLGTSGRPAHSVDISGRGWLEVDDERDFARAELRLSAERWYG